MKKNTLILLFIMLILISLSSCKSNKKIKEYEDGYFKYVIDNDEVYLTGFTDKGKKIKYLDFPETIDNKKIVGLGYKYNGKYYNDFEYSNILKIYVNENTWTILNNSNCFYWNNREITNLMGITFVFKSVFEFELDTESNSKYIHFCFEYSYLKNITSSIYDYTKIGNINYNYNYENSPYDGIYFTDYWNGTIVKYIPADPIREGYKFIGWYKEKECINLWDFNNDKCGDLIYAKDIDDIDNYEYSGINLYAKWEKE